MRLFACGDVTNCTSEEGIICGDSLADLIRGSDYAICNFEGPVPSNGKPEPKIGPHLQQKEGTLDSLKANGFDLLLLANNHIMDFGEEGLSATLECAESAELDTVGAGVDRNVAYRPLIKSINGIRVGIVNGAEAQFGVLDDFDSDDRAGYAWINDPRIDRTIVQLRNECDFVLVFCHAGLENFDVPQLEWRMRYQHFVELGADVVIGTHPHIPQGYERHKQSLIFYSLGNFFFDHSSTPGQRNSSYAVQLELVKGKAPRFEPVFHETQGNCVDMATGKSRVDIDYLCSRLGADYPEALDLMVADSYPRVRHDLVKSMVAFSLLDCIGAFARNLVSVLRGRITKRDLRLRAMHLYRNETYYYVVRRGLQIAAMKKKERE